MRSSISIIFWNLKFLYLWAITSDQTNKQGRSRRFQVRVKIKKLTLVLFLCSSKTPFSFAVVKNEFSHLPAPPLMWEWEMSVLVGFFMSTVLWAVLFAFAIGYLARNGSLLAGLQSILTAEKYWGGGYIFFHTHFNRYKLTLLLSYIYTPNQFWIWLYY